MSFKIILLLYCDTVLMQSSVDNNGADMYIYIYAYISVDIHIYIYIYIYI